MPMVEAEMRRKTTISPQSEYNSSEGSCDEKLLETSSLT
jgi:hypothetical protein